LGKQCIESPHYGTDLNFGSRRCHAFRLDTGERKTISLESGASKALIVVTSTVAIIYLTNIIIWETNTGKSWKVETSLVEPRVWAYDLDPVGHIISRIYFDETASMVRQEQFPYGEKVEECYQKSWALGRVPEHSDTPMRAEGGFYVYSSYRAYQSAITVWQNFRRGGGCQFSWFLPDEVKGMAMPSLAYDYSRGKWKMREYALPETFNPRCRFYTIANKTYTYVLDDALVFLLNGRNNFAEIYVSDGDGWIEWEGEEWQVTPDAIGVMSERYVIILRHGSERTVEVRRFMGIHERKTFEERYRGKVDDAYGTLLGGEKLAMRE